MVDVEVEAFNVNVLTPVWNVFVAPATGPGPVTVMVIGFEPPPPPLPGSAVRVNVPVAEGANRTAVPASNCTTLVILGGVSDVKPNDSTEGVEASEPNGELDADSVPTIITEDGLVDT